MGMSGNGGRTVAVKVGCSFALVTDEELAGIDLRAAGTTVNVGGSSHPLFAGETFTDSRRIDALLDSHGEMAIADHEVTDEAVPSERTLRFGDWEFNVRPTLVDLDGSYPSVLEGVAESLAEQRAAAVPDPGRGVSRPGPGGSELVADRGPDAAWRAHQM